MAAHELAPSLPDVLRASAEFYSVFNAPDAFVYWGMLEGSGSMNDADRLAYARLALNLRRQDLARQALWPFHRANPNDPEGLILVSKLFAQEGDLRRAREAAERAAAVGGNREIADLQLATLELDSSQPEDWERAKKRLLTLAMTGSGLRAEAAVILLARNLATRSEEQLLERLLPADEKASLKEKAVRLTLALRQNPARAGELIRSFIAAHGISADSPEPIMVGEILAQTGQHRALLELIPEATALKNHSLCRLRLGALSVTGDVAATDRLLTNPAIPLPPAQVAIFQASAAQAAGRTNEVEQLWKIALNTCRIDAGDLKLLARNAEAVGARQIAAQALEILLLDPMYASQASTELLRLGMALREPRAIYLALRRIVELRPDDTESRLGLAYCQLLLEVDGEAAERTLAAGPAAYQNRNLYQIVAALKALRRKNADQAVRELENPSVNWAEAPVAWRVVRTAALGMAGLDAEARKVGATLSPEELSLQELTLAEPWLRRDTRSRASSE